MPRSATTFEEELRRLHRADADAEKLEEAKGSKFKQIKEKASRQRKKERQQRLEEGGEDVLSSDDEDGKKKGLGMTLLEYMKKDTNEVELIEAFKRCLEEPAATLDKEEHPPFVPPEYGSSISPWSVSEDFSLETARITEGRKEKGEERLAKGMKRLAGLGDKLDLSNIGMDDTAATECAQVLLAVTHLKELSLSMNKLGPEGARQFGPVLAQNREIVLLSVAHNNLGNEGTEIILDSVKDITSLKELYLDHNSIGPSFPHAIRGMTQLQHLRLRGNNLEEFPFECLISLPKLDLGGNTAAMKAYVSRYLDQETTEANKRAARKAGLSAMEQAWKAWADLDVKLAAKMLSEASDHLKLGDMSEEMESEMADLRDAIERRRSALGPSFQKVENPYQIMAGEAVERVVEKIKGGASDISLHSMHIGDNGAASVAQALKGNTVVTRLDFFGCDVGPKGIGAIAASLNGNTSLDSLWLGKNAIKDEGATYLAQWLETNTTLAKLDVAHNGIGPSGMTSLAHSLQANPTIKELNFSMNKLGDAGATAVVHSLKLTRNLQELDMSGSGIGSAGSAVITEELKFHPGLLRGKLWR